MSASARACTGGGSRLSAAMASARPFQSMTVSALAGAASAIHTTHHPASQNPQADTFFMVATLMISQRQQKVIERPVRHSSPLDARRLIGEAEVDAQQD